MEFEWIKKVRLASCAIRLDRIEAVGELALGAPVQAARRIDGYRLSATCSGSS